MQKLYFAFAVALLLAGSSVVMGQRSAVMKPINQFVNGFNKGDMQSTMAACSETTAIIDEFPPHSWSGDGACQKFADDYDAYTKKNRITNGRIRLGKPTRVDIMGDHAYVVFPSNYIYKQKGKPMAGPGSIFTVALHKRDASWIITGWSWSTK